MGNKESKKVAPKHTAEDMDKATRVQVKSTSEDIEQETPNPNSTMEHFIEKQPKQPLIAACEEGNTEIVKLLLSHKFDTNVQDKNGCSPLITASQNGHCEIVKLLIVHKADLDLRDILGNTALMLACVQGHTDIVSMLLEAGASIDLANEKGYTALHQACSTRQFKCVQKLIDKNADDTLRAESNETALDIARKGRDLKTIQTIMQPAIESRRQSTSPQLATKKSSPAIQKPQTPKHQTPNHHYYTSAHTVVIHSHAGAIPQTPDDIARNVGLDHKRLDTPCDQDLLRKIADCLPNWMEYAAYLNLKQKDIRMVEKMGHVTQAYYFLKIWYRKNQREDTSQCHYRALVEASCSLGYYETGKEICELIERHDLVSPQADSNVHILDLAESINSTVSLRVAMHVSYDLTFFPSQVIGSGAFGTVFEGEFKEQPCAVKVLRALADEVQLSLPTTTQTEPIILQRFKEECQRLKAINHPNIVRHLTTEQYPRNNNHLILALELMDCNLRQFFQPESGPGRYIPEEALIKVCHDIASGLRYLHSRRIVHRDLCSDNILLLGPTKETRTAKICDFGMSKLFSEEEKSISLMIMGRKGYIPPEASNKATVYHPSFDVFSFGVIMIQTIRRVPNIDSPKHRVTELDKIKVYHPLNPTIKECLRENRNDRPSAIEVENEIRVSL